MFFLRGEEGISLLAQNHYGCRSGRSGTENMKSFALLQVVKWANTAKGHPFPEHISKGVIITASDCLAGISLV